MWQYQLSQIWINSNTNCSNKKGAMESCQILTCAGFLYLHDLNANYCCMKKRSLTKYRNIPSLQPGFGGVMDSVGCMDHQIWKWCWNSWHANAANYVNCQCLVNSFKCQLQTYETWIRMKELLIHHEWRGWMIKLKKPIQKEMLIFLGSIVSINYAYKVITCTKAPEIPKL